MNDENKMIWREMIVTHFKVLSQNSPGETKESHKNISEDCR
jgi:hypothetical protein